MNKFLKDAKGESHLVATLLLVAVAVASSMITYSWVMSITGMQSQQVQTQIRIDEVSYENSTSGATKIILTIRNTGSVTAILDSVSVAIDQSTVIATLADKTSIPAGQTGTYTFTAGIDGVPVGWRWMVQKSYVIRATTTTAFYYEKLSSSPSTYPAPS